MSKQVLGSLESMIKANLENNPEHAPAAIKEYLTNIETDTKVNKDELRKKLVENKAYDQKFRFAITGTSIMVFLLARKALNLTPVIDIGEYSREFLYLSQKDDKDIYDMKLYHLTELTAENMELGSLDEETFDSKEELQKAQEAAAEIKKSYDEMLLALRKVYVEGKVHLLYA